MIKKTIVYLLLLCSCITFPYVHAADSEEKLIKIMVSEPVPGAKCTQRKPNIAVDKNGLPTPILWECSIKSGTAQAIATIGVMVKFFSIIAGLLGVMFLVYNGILYSMGGLNESLKTESKNRIIATLIGLLLLFSSGYILQLIAPWVYK